MDLEKIKEHLQMSASFYQMALDNLERAQKLLEAAVEADTEDGYWGETASGAQSVIDRMSVVYNEKTKLLPSEIGYLLQYVRGTFER